MITHKKWTYVHYIWRRNWKSIRLQYMAYLVTRTSLTVTAASYIEGYISDVWHAKHDIQSDGVNVIWNIGQHRLLLCWHPVIYVMMTSSNGEKIPLYLPFVRGIHRSPVNSPHKGQWRRALTFSLICTWMNGWTNNREAGDLRRHRAHYEVTIMVLFCPPLPCCICFKKHKDRFELLYYRAKLLWSW